MSKCFTTTLDLKKIQDKVYEELRETFIAYGVILTLQRQSCLEYLASEGKKKFYDYEEDEKTAQHDTLQRIGYLVGESASEAYKSGYTEGRSDGERDVLKAVKEGIDRGYNIEEISDLLQRLTEVSDKMFAEHTKGKPVLVQLYDEDDEEKHKSIDKK